MTFFHRPVELVELLILYARVQFYTPRTSDYRLISKTVYIHVHYKERVSNRLSKLKMYQIVTV